MTNNGRPPFALTTCEECLREFVLRSWQLHTPGARCGYCEFKHRIEYASNPTVADLVWGELAKWYSTQGAVIRLWREQEKLSRQNLDAVTTTTTTDEGNDEDPF